MTKSEVHKLLFFRLPIAWIAGLRLQSYDQESATIRVKFGWLNQNPFRSMFWAVQGMAAELSTGLLVIRAVRASGRNVSLLVVEQDGKFYKKAVGKIAFTCEQGAEAERLVQTAIETGQGQTLRMHSKGVDKNGVTVSEFSFVWSVKVKG